MKSRFILPIALIALAMVFVACEIEDDADADSTASETVTPPACDPACVSPQVCQSGTCVDPTPQGTPHRFVRIDDLSPMSETDDGGADIDAVTLFKADGSSFYAVEIVAYAHGGGEGMEVDPTESLFAPDAFYDYPDTDVCAVDGGFVSLGGTGGYMVARIGDNADANADTFTAGIEQGDTLEVLEVGGCDFVNSSGETRQAIVEEVEVAVSVASDPANQYWVTLGTGEGPEILFTIQDLPKVTE